MQRKRLALFPETRPEAWQMEIGTLLSAAHRVDYAPPLSPTTRHNASGPCQRDTAAPARQRQELRARYAWFVLKNLEPRMNVEEPRCGHVC